MNKTKKITVALIALVLGVIVSPAIALNEVDAMKKSVELEDTVSISDITKTVRIVGLEEMSFAPNTINITHGNTINFLNADGSNGGTSHTVTSVKIGTSEPNGMFDSGNLKVGQTYQVTFLEPGIYEYFDSIHPTFSGRIYVK